MNIIGMMPIKLQNERLPGKNTKLLGEKPLLQYGLNSMLETELLDDLYVYCSSEKVIPFLPSDVKFLKRPEYLDLPTSNFTDFFSAFMQTKDADIYVVAHATAPFIKVETIKECISAVQTGCYDSAFCAEKIQTFLWKEGEPLNFDPSNLPRTQDLIPIYRETSGVYVFRREVFQNYRRRIGVSPYIKCVSFKEAVDIDEPSDFQLAEALLNVNV